MIIRIRELEPVKYENLIFKYNRVEGNNLNYSYSIFKPYNQKQK